MKISIDCRFIGKSGIGTFIENVADEMILHHPENEYLLITEEKIEKYEKAENVKFLITDIQPFTIKELLLFPIRQINETDAFFSPYINIPLGIKIPVYCTIHDVIFLDMPELVSRVGLWVRTLFIKHAIRMSRAIFTVSNFSKNRIVFHFKTNKNIIVCHAGIARYIKSSNVTESTKDNYYIYVGNIKKHKGLTVLLQAYKKACENGLREELYIVGEKNKFRSKDVKFEELLDSVSNVHFTGFLSNDELMNYISHAKALILPSFYEGFGLPPMEALYLGTHSIISDIEVFKEIYKNFPVVYFHVGDSDDLMDKMLHFQMLEFNVKNIREKICKTFDFAKVTNKILDKITTDFI